MPLKTPKTKLEGIFPKDVEEDTCQVKTTLLRQTFPEGLSNILLGIPKDPIFTFLDRVDRKLSENRYFYSLWCIVFELWLFALRHATTLQNGL